LRGKIAEIGMDATCEWNFGCPRYVRP
jgi:hypothetical protein